MSPASSSSQPLRMGARSFLYTPISNTSSGSRNHLSMTLSALSNTNTKSLSSSASSTGPMTLSPRVHRLLFSTTACLSSIAAITLLSSPFLTNVLADALTAYLPRFWKAAPIPASPVSFLPVSETAVKRVRDLLASLRFDPLAAGIIGGISVEQLRKDIRFLTNEDGESGIVSRHSFHEGSRIAATWIKQQFEQTGATCRLVAFEDFAPNVIW